MKALPISCIEKVRVLSWVGQPPIMRPILYSSYQQPDTLLEDPVLPLLAAGSRLPMYLVFKAAESGQRDKCVVTDEGSCIG